MSPSCQERARERALVNDVIILESAEIVGCDLRMNGSRERERDRERERERERERRRSVEAR